MAQLTRSFELSELQSLLAELDGLKMGACGPNPLTTARKRTSPILSAKPEETPFFECLRSEMKQILAAAISELPEKERRGWLSITMKS